jgi:hypothetical protein
MPANNKNKRKRRHKCISKLNWVPPKTSTDATNREEHQESKDLVQHEGLWRKEGRKATSQARQKLPSTNYMHTKDWSARKHRTYQTLLREKGTPRKGSGSNDRGTCENKPLSWLTKHGHHISPVFLIPQGKGFVVSWTRSIGHLCLPHGVTSDY